ncbi:MAG TPA: tRNA pseudouridine(38-40) synthase TruA [Ignavibacteria bacterium]|nr:tRNA pseudouridine(38-40) synthase TruA [Ignavibacteria bacterium]
MAAVNQVNVKLIVEYDGKNYSGWQRQKTERSVQQTLEEKLSVLLPGEKVTLNGAGRTDAGVHAYGQCANFKIEKSRIEKTGLSRLLVSLNALLPDDIVVKDIRKAPPEFHARYSAKRREYVYRLTEIKRAIEGDKLLLLRSSFDIKAAKSFCTVIKGNHSFRSLCKNKKDEHDFRSIVYSCDVKRKKDGIIEFTISANRFLHSMVRAVVGAMIKVASGDLTKEEFIKKFKNGDEMKIQYVPAKALFLSKVTY